MFSRRSLFAVGAGVVLAPEPAAQEPAGALSFQPGERDGSGRMRLSYRLSSPGEAGAAALGGIWDGPTYVRFSLEARFDGSNTDGAGGSPAATLLSFAHASGSAKDVCSGLFVCWATSGSGFGLNVIAAAPPGAANPKLIALEGDVEPSRGVRPGAGSGCFFANAFNSEDCGPVLQSGGVGGGKFTNGFVAYDVSGAVVAGGAGASLGALTNTGAASYRDGAAHILSAGHRIRFDHSPSTSSSLGGDASGLNLDIGGAGLVIRETSAHRPLVRVSPGGAVAIGASRGEAGEILTVASANATEGLAVATLRAASDRSFATFRAAEGASPNPSPGALHLAANRRTGRSLNAGGTVNASGADFAEYELKCAGMTGRHAMVAKGDIVGFDSEGLLTDRYADAMSFGVKSTSPAYVGGDDFGAPVVFPEPPCFEPPLFQGPGDPGPVCPTPGRARRDTDRGAAEAEAMQRDWERSRRAHARALKIHEHRVRDARQAFEAVVVPAWRDAVEEARRRVDQQRLNYDRIAYAGKVPVNVRGAEPGDYIIARAGPDGGIAATVVRADSMTFQQWAACVGRVRATLPDGRALIVVKPV